MSSPHYILDPYKNVRYVIPHVYSRPCPPIPSISLFTGAGGLDLGLERAGFATAAYVEKDINCQKTIGANRQWTLVKDGDITNIPTQEILDAAHLKVGEVGLVSGGAPCQPFSSLGKGDGETNSTGKLYLEFIRVVKEAKPHAFVFENVRGMLLNHKTVIDFMEQEFSVLGYATSTVLLCAADYGVPQKRYRVFMIGLRDGTSPAFPFPTHAENPGRATSYFNELISHESVAMSFKPWTTVRQAFNKLSSEHYRRPDALRAQLNDKIREMIAYIRPNSSMYWINLPDELKFECWKRGKFQGKDNFSRLQWDKPSVTIRTGAIYPAKGRYIHPEKNRGLNTIELAALQSFPLSTEEEWRFNGGITAIARQIGNAVPPLLAQHIGRAIYDQIAPFFFPTEHRAQSVVMV